jgi:hypothetical protein
MKNTAIVIGLVVVGSLQMIGDVLNIPVIKGFGAAIHASPAPKVFTAQAGFETYSSRFYLDWTDKVGKTHTLEITPENYAGVRGPYNRRNVYGAAVSYGPVLVSNPRTAAMFHSVMRYAFCGEAPLLTELGIDPKTLSAPPRLRLQPRIAYDETRNWQLQFQAVCHE